MLETLQKLTQWAVGLTIPSKVILSAVLFLITLFALSILWNSPLERAKSGSPSDSNNGNSANVTVQGQDIPMARQKKASDDPGQQLSRKKLEEFKRLNDQLKINQTDTWSEVIGKAISLRELGRIPDAMMTFQQYERMFSSIDPGAKSYAGTAKAFTQQMKSLKVRGGIYLYQILDGAAAQEASLKVGDIIIEYDGKAIAKMDSLLAGLNNSHEDKANRITYLRFHPETGHFTRHIGVIKGGPFGAGFMPI